MVARAARAPPAVTMAVTQSPHPAHLPTVTVAASAATGGKAWLPWLYLPAGHCIVWARAGRGAAEDWPPRALLPRPPPPAASRSIEPPRTARRLATGLAPPPDYY